MDRESLINALSNAFQKTEPEKEDIRSTVTTGVAGEKDVLRLFTNQNKSTHANLTAQYPEVYFVANFVEELQRCGQSDIDVVAREMITKFNKAVDENDDAKIRQMIEKSKELFYQLHVIDLSSPERAIANLLAVDAIKAF